MYKLLISAVAVLFAIILLPFPIPTFSYAVVNVFALSALLIAMVAIGVKMYRKEPVDGYFTVGIGFLALGITVFILNNFSLLPGSFITANGSKLGTGAEVIFLSLSMSNLIRKLRSDKEVAQSIALRKSEDMNELKSYFMKNMSHELRTPLNAIMGITDVMLCEDIPASVRSNFEIIKYSSHSLLSSVNDILDFNQIEKGEITLDKHEFDPIALFKQLELNARKQATDKGLMFTFEVDEIPPALLGDEARLSQIVNNVLSNAVKFTSAGYVSVRVMVSARFDEQIELKITISDSGVGIPKDKMESIYEAFTQESINNKRKFGGLGLGLSIVKKLVELYQGTIQMESKIGQGTTCTLVLPFVVVAKTVSKEPELPVAPVETAQEENKGLHILLVEDNTMNQLLMKLIMQKWEGVTFAIANHGGECLTLLQQQRFDVVLMDLQMPVMDGYEAATAIRAGEAGVGNISIPIIALTADITEGTEQRVKQIGMDKYMSKPVNQDALLKVVHQLTGKVSV
jgi:signal transduction histidine kinase/ActR/RegA family two-component response regulator